MNGTDTERVIPPAIAEYEEIVNCNDPTDVVINFSQDSAVKQYQNDLEFSVVIHEAELAIENDIRPELSKRGSSGCYFVKNRDAVSTSIKYASNVIHVSIISLVILLS